MDVALHRLFFAMPVAQMTSTVKRKTRTYDVRAGLFMFGRYVLSERGAALP